MKIRYFKGSEIMEIKEPEFNKFAERGWGLIKAIIILAVGAVCGILYTTTLEVRDLKFRVDYIEKELKINREDNKDNDNWRKSIEEKLSNQLIAIKLIQKEAENTNKKLEDLISDLKKSKP